MSPRRPRRHGPFLSARGFALVLYTLTLAFIAVSVTHCFRS